MNASPAHFFVFDGVDGAGKTTQIARFCELLESAGRRVTMCRDPGTTALGERIRSLLLTPGQQQIDFRAEMLLYMAARAQLVDEIIRPALLAGQTVISDRFLLANVVYQGYAGGLPIDAIWDIGAQATGGLRPDLTFVLDLDPRRAAERRQSEPDRLEQRGLEYFDRVRAGFLAEAQRQPDQIVIIDASQSPDDVFQQIRVAATRVGGGGVK